MMEPAASRKFLLRAALGAMLGAAVLIGAPVTSASADDDDPAPDVKILRDIMTTLGLRRDGEDINYRERSPLVVPPNRNLAAPGTNQAAEKNPAWPNDPDVKRRKEAKTKAKDARPSVNWEEELRPLRPDALRGSSTGGNNRPTESDNRRTDPNSPMKPSELGYKGNVLSGIFGSPKEEYMTFTGEAPRNSLIEPPTGYRTPSPNQPYGVGKEKWTPPKIDRQEVIR